MIQIKEIGFRYKDKKIFENFSLDIRENEAVLITGSNGAGKTTLLRLMAGILFPDSGRIEYGQALGKEPRAGIGFISDQMSLYHSMTLQEAIDLHCRVHGAREFPDKILAEAKLDHKKKVSEFSAGQKLIFHLGLVLATQPRLLLLDEILHAIDPYLREIFIRHVLEMLTSGQTTLVMVNLNYHDIEHIPQRVIILKDNKIALDQPMESLKEKVKKIVSNEEIAGLPTFLKREFAGSHEYFVYPFEKSMVGTQGSEVHNLNLNDIVTAFIGGEYA
jgi:ABC-type multidrug transport system ATPase subunit